MAGNFDRDRPRHAGSLEVPHRGTPKVVLEHAGAPGLSAGRRPGFAEVAVPTACVPPRQVREHIRDDTPEASAETMYAVQLLREERLEFRSQVNDPAFRVLGGSWIKAHRPRPEIHVPPLERQDLGAHPPAVRVRERDSDPEIFREVAADGFIAIRLKEAGPRRRLLEELERQHSQNLPVPSREPKPPTEERQLAVDRGVRRETSQMRLRRLSLGDVAQGEIGGDARDAPTAKEAVEVREPTLQLAQVLPPTRRLVVRAEIGRDLVVEDAVDPGRDRRPSGGGALAQPCGP